MIDITSYVQSFITGMQSLMSQLYEILDSITFMGVSLLDFFLSIFILGLVFPLILSLLSSRQSESRKGK